MFATLWDNIERNKGFLKYRVDLNNKTILITGSPGFIGANLVLRLLSEMTVGRIISLDNMNNYYDVGLKEYRLSRVNAAARESKVDHLFIKGSITIDKQVGTQPVSLNKKSPYSLSPQGLLC